MSEFIALVVGLVAGAVLYGVFAARIVTAIKDEIAKVHKAVSGVQAAVTAQVQATEASVKDHVDATVGAAVTLAAEAAQVT